MDSFVVAEIGGFLRTVPPFEFLDDDALQKVVQEVTVEFIPKGTQVLRQGGPPAEQLFVVRQGGVKIFVQTGVDEETVIDYRGEGDLFGFLSLLSGGHSRESIVTVEDTTVYRVPRESVFDILRRKPDFAENYVKSFLNTFVDKTFAAAQSKNLLSAGGDKLLHTTTVGELVAREPVTALDTVSIREAAGIMSARGVSSLILMDEEDVPTGILTDRDLREKVVAKDRSVDAPVSTIMSVSLIRVEASDLCFEALLKMIRFDIHHLVVVDAGRLKGVVTNHDLMILQGTSPLSLARGVESQHTVEGLTGIAGKTTDLITLLLKEGARASNITHLVTEVNDRLLRQIILIAERTLGAPPLRYCWISFGSEGRKEQTFKTDQDNAIIHEDPRDAAEEAKAREYFAAFAALVNEGLIRCGFPVCPGNYMARNPQWCQPLAVWERYFTEWIATPTEEAILRSVILFDFRGIAGELALAETLKGHLLRTVANQGIFLKKLADLTVSVRPPMGFINTLVMFASGEHKDEIDLKHRCLTPLVNIARLFALESGAPETGTLDRLHALRDRHRIVRESGEDLKQAFEFFSLLRIHHQLGQILSGREPDNLVNPKSLTNLQRKIFREACQLISRVQDSIAREYNPGMRL